MIYKYHYSNRKSRIITLSIVAIIALLTVAFWIHKVIILSIMPIYPSWYSMKKALDTTARMWMLSYSLPWFVLMLVVLTEFCTLLMKTNRFDASDYNNNHNLLINKYTNWYTSCRHKPYYMETTEKLPNGAFTKFIVSEHTDSDKAIAHEFIAGNVSEDELHRIIASRRIRVIIRSNPEHKTIQITRYFPTLTDAEHYIEKFKTEYWRTITK